MTNRTRSLASRVITSSASASASPPRASAVVDRSTNGITATEARRDAGMMRVSPAAGTAGAETWMPGGEAAWALADCQAWRSGAVSRPSPSNSRAVTARCSSPSRIWPPRANALSRSSWTRGSKGASWSHCSRYGNASSSGSRLTRCSSRAAWLPRNRRRWAVSQPSKTGLRPISRPSRSSPPNSAASARCRSGGSFSMPSPAARATSIASTRQFERSSHTVSPRVWTRFWPRSSTRPRTLLRHQRSSPRGSFGTSQRSSHNWLRAAGRGARAR